MKRRNVEKREKVTKELLQTERDYVKDIKLCYEGFIGSLKDQKFQTLLARAIAAHKQQEANQEDNNKNKNSKPIARGVELDILFGNVEQVIDVSERFLENLEDSVASKPAEDQLTGMCFINYSKELEDVYSQYCRNHDDAIALLEKLKGHASILGHHISVNINKDYMESFFFCVQCLSTALLHNHFHSLKEFRKNRSTESFDTYRKNRNKFRSICREKKKNYTDIQFNRYRDDWRSVAGTVGMWSVIKRYRKGGFESAPISGQQWIDYFSRLHNPQTMSFGDTFEDVNEYRHLNSESVQVNVDLLNARITDEEILTAVSELKKGKAAGPDGIPSEFYKCTVNRLLPLMSDLFNDIFETGVFPEGWCRGVIIPLYKNGVRSDPNNYRGITLLDVFGKVFCAILNKRLYVWAEDIGSISSCQSGFRKGFSTMDNIFTLYAIIQNYLRRRRGKFFCLFVDFAKAFDSVNYHYLFIKLQSIGLSGKMFNIIKSMYDDVKSCVKLDRGISEYFNCGIGVRQGSVLSPVLFSLFIDELYQIITKAGFKGVQLTQDMFDLFVLLYADDVVIFADTVVGLQHLINCLGQFCDKWKLKANFKKTKVVTFRKGGHSSRNEIWHLNGTSIEVVSYYNYLGLLLSCRNKWSKAVSNLADQARKAMFSIFSFERKVGVITHEVYFKLFDSLILPILLYGSELWGFQQFMQIEMVQLKYCKHFLGVRQNTTNEAVLGDCGRTPIFVKSLTRCIKYWLRLTELPDNRVAKHAYKLMLKIDESGHTSWATEYEDNPDIQEYISDGLSIVRQSTNCWDLASFLIKPVQRILKYPLLLNELIKVTEDGHGDKHNLLTAINTMTDVASAINEFKRRKDLVLKYRKSDSDTISNKLGKLNLHSIKKKSQRMNQRFSQVTGFGSQTIDENFIEEERRFRDLEKTIKIFVKDVNSYLEKLQESTSSQATVAEDIADYYANQSNLDEVAKYSRSQRDLANKLYKTYTLFVQQRVVSPLNQLLIMFQGPHKLIQKRFDKLLDYDSVLQKAEKGGHEKKKDEREMAKRNYAAMNTQLLDELPKLYSLSVTLLKECVQSFIEAERDHFDATLKRLYPLLKLPMILDSSRENILDHFNCKHQVGVEKMMGFTFVPRSFDKKSGEKKSIKKVTSPAKSVQSHSSSQDDAHRAYLLSRYPTDALYRVTQDYTAKDSMDISIKKSDVVGILKKQDPMGGNEKWYVDNGGKIFIFEKMKLLPYGYMTIVELSVTMVTVISLFPTASQGFVPPTLLEPCGDEYKTAPIASISDLSSSSRSHTGSVTEDDFGSSYLQQSQPQQQQQPEPQYYYAEWAFEGTGPNEVSLTEGGLVTVIEMHDIEGNLEWWLVEKDGQQGYVPANYLARM
ncbi:uncharacterized protein LOC144434256 [Glandiceps talaboti]